MPKVTLTRAEKKAGLDLRDVLGPLGPRERKKRKQETARGAKQWQKTAASELRKDKYIQRVREAIVFRISDSLTPSERVQVLDVLSSDITTLLEDACRDALRTKRARK